VVVETIPKVRVIESKIDHLPISGMFELEYRLSGYGGVVRQSTVQHLLYMYPLNSNHALHTISCLSDDRLTPVNEMIKSLLTLRTIMATTQRDPP
jgi:hypothetical protein